MDAIGTFGISMPGRILFGRGEAARAPREIAGFGQRGLLVTGANPARSAWLVDALQAEGVTLSLIRCGSEPDLPMLEAALAEVRPLEAQFVVALGGGAVIDLGKALAGLIPAPGGIMDHLEVVGKGLPLVADPLPFIALPTTAGTGAEVTKNAVIGLPAHGRKVSVRDERMLANLAIVDPALTDGAPWSVTLASGLDALAQVIEPHVSCKATPFTQALTRPVIAPAMAALMQLAKGEDQAARDVMAWTSLTGGLALANAGLGAVHGLAGVIGGETGAAHGAICGALLGPVLEMNRARSEGQARALVDEVCALIAGPLGVTAEEAPRALAAWARSAGLPGLEALGLEASDHAAVAEASRVSSSMKGNPVPLGTDDLITLIRAGA